MIISPLEYIASTLVIIALFKCLFVWLPYTHVLTYTSHIEGLQCIPNPNVNQAFVSFITQYYSLLF